MIRTLLLLVLAPLAVHTPHASGVPVEPTAPQPLLVERGPDLLPLRVPAHEELVYSVGIDLGRVGVLRLGSVTLTAEHGVEPGPLPAPGEPARTRRYAELRSVARGSYLGYRLEHVLTTRHLLDQGWPSIVYSDVQRGSENRRRELRLGAGPDGGSAVRYRSDHHCGGCERREHLVESHLFWRADHHCDRCRRGEHRTWKEPVVRDAPPGTLDVLSAVYLARELVVSGEREASFPMLDKLDLWTVHLELGEVGERTTAAGTFRCREVLLSSSVPEGEERAEDARFAGLFGIRGALRIHVDEATGVPVWIEGSVPAGPLELDVFVRLESVSNGATSASDL